MRLILFVRSPRQNLGTSATTSNHNYSGSRKAQKIGRWFVALHLSSTGHVKGNGCYTGRRAESMTDHFRLKREQVSPTFYLLVRKSYFVKKPERLHVYKLKAWISEIFFRWCKLSTKIKAIHCFTYIIIKDCFDK